MPMRRRRCATGTGSTSRSRDRATSSTGNSSATRFPRSRSGRSETQDLWAPSVIYDGSTYFMYYSATPDAATSQVPTMHWRSRHRKSPAGPFVDIGMPCSLGMGFEISIRWPTTIRSPAKACYIGGRASSRSRFRSLAPTACRSRQEASPSTWSGQTRQGRRLPAAGRSLMGDPARRFLLSVLLGRQLLRPHAEYEVMVARSKSATGPFETLEQAKGVPHSLMLFKSDRWLAPGHNSIVTDKEGDIWIVYHAIDVNGRGRRQEDEINSRRILLIDKIEWKDGWPHVGTPSDVPQPLQSPDRAADCDDLRSSAARIEASRCPRTRQQRSSTWRPPSATMVENKPVSA